MTSTQQFYCLLKGRHSEAAMKSRDVLPKNVPGVGGVGYAGVRWVMQGCGGPLQAWGGSCRGEVGWGVMHLWVVM